MGEGRSQLGKKIEGEGVKLRLRPEVGGGKRRLGKSTELN